MQGSGVRIVERDVGRHDEDGYRTGFGRGGGETGDRVVGLVEQENDFWHQTTALAEENRNGRAAAGHISSEDRDTVI